MQGQGARPAFPQAHADGSAIRRATREDLLREPEHPESAWTDAPRYAPAPAKVQAVAALAQKMAPMMRKVAPIRRNAQRYAPTARKAHAVLFVAEPPRRPTVARRRTSHSARPGHHRTAASSPTSGTDPGDDSDPADLADRRCEACGADISDRRRGARTCDALCRKRLSRGNVARDPLIAPPAQPLEDVIDEIAHKRHLAWISPDRDSVEIEELQKYLVDLYAVLRRQRARGPLPEFRGNIASYDFDVRAARQFRQPRRRGRSTVATTQLGAVAA